MAKNPSRKMKELAMMGVWRPTSGAASAAQFETQRQQHNSSCDCEPGKTESGNVPCPGPGH
ncbi:MAG: hypothetical protein DWI22_01790 [Planctomycetota bacterium]|nr:MAG: hypothetical protein DWI22_01790 [Planctomycetota bacterium]